MIVDAHYSSTGRGECQLAWMYYMHNFTQILSNESVFWFHLASFVNVPCLVAECHGSIWGCCLVNGEEFLC